MVAPTLFPSHPPAVGAPPKGSLSKNPPDGKFDNKYPLFRVTSEKARKLAKTPRCGVFAVEVLRRRSKTKERSDDGVS